MPRSICFQENVTAYLMYFTVLKIAAEQFDHFVPGQISRQLQQAATTSSRTRCTRIESAFC
jgi:hypothetical protein